MSSTKETESFGIMLRRLMARGVGNPLGLPWSQSELVRTLDTSERSLRNWLTDRNAPNDMQLKGLTRVFFGPRTSEKAEEFDRFVEACAALRIASRSVSSEISSSYAPVVPESKPSLPRQLAEPIPLLPIHYVPRAADLEALVEMLISPDRRVGITAPRRIATAVQAMGGSGKSVMAAAAALDRRVQAAFPGGIFWLTLGQTPNIEAVQDRLLGALGAELPEPRADRRKRLQDALGGRRCLVVIDDVWELSHLSALAVPDTAARYLFTTRRRSIVEESGAAEQRLEVLSPEMSLAFLAAAVGLAVEELPEMATEVVRECGHLPLALAVTAAQLRRRKKDESLWLAVLDGLKRADHESLRNDFEGYPHRHVFAALEASLGMLGEADRRAYLDLAIFAEEEAVPFGALERLWSQELGALAARNRADDLVDLALAQPAERGIALHDLQRDYVRRRCPDTHAVHVRLIEAYRRSCAGQWHNGPDDVYFLQHLALHLREVDAAAWQDLLLDPRWMKRKLEEGMLTELLADYRDASRPVQLVGDALRLSSHVLAKEPSQLFSQLAGRLGGSEIAEHRSVLERIAPLVDRPNILPRSGSLTAPGGPLIRTLESHGDGVTAVAITPDGKSIVSGNWNGTLKLWALHIGKELRTLQGHRDQVSAIAITPDGRRAVSSSQDATVKLWDLQIAEELRTFEGHGAWVSAVAITPDGTRAVSGSHDHTLKLWDLDTGQTLHTLEGHGDLVTAVAITPDGTRVVSASHDRTLKLWDLDSGQTMRTLEGHKLPILAAAITPDGRRAVSASSDGTLKLWDLSTGQTLRTLEDSGPGVIAVAITPDGRRVISGSYGGTLRLWDLDTGQELCSLMGHRSWVGAVAITPDGTYAVSGSLDGTLKLWDLDSGQTLSTLESHSITAVAITQDGRRAVSASNNCTLKLWDLETGQTLRTLERDGASVSEIAITPDGRRAVSRSSDATLKVWDLQTGEELRTLGWVGDWIGAVAITPDGTRAVSASSDRTLKLWDLQTGEELRTFPGHGDGVRAVAITPDGRRAVSASDDQTLVLWDLQTGKKLRTFYGHQSAVYAVVITPDGARALSASSDGTLKLWDLSTGACLATFTGDYRMLCVAFAGPDRIVAGDAGGHLHFLDLVQPGEPWPRPWS